MLKVTLCILSASFILQNACSQSNHSGEQEVLPRQISEKTQPVKRQATDIPVDLFKPVYTETEKPLNLADVPTIKLQGQPKIVFNHSTFNEQSSASGKDINDEDDISQIDKDLDENNRDEQKKNVRNFEYKIDGSNPNATLPQDFEDALRSVTLPGIEGSQRSFLDFIQDTIKQQTGKGEFTLRISEDKKVAHTNKTIPVDGSESSNPFDTFGDLSQLFPLSFSSRNSETLDSDKAKRADSNEEGIILFDSKEEPDTKDSSERFIFDRPQPSDTKEEEQHQEQENKTLTSLPEATPMIKSNKSLLNKTRSRLEKDNVDYDDSREEEDPAYYQTPRRRTYKPRRKPYRVYDDSAETSEDYYPTPPRQRNQRLPVRRVPISRRTNPDYDYEDDEEYPSAYVTRRRSYSNVRRRPRPVYVDDYSDEDYGELERRRTVIRRRPVSKPLPLKRRPQPTSEDQDGNITHEKPLDNEPKSNRGNGDLASMSTIRRSLRPQIRASAKRYYDY